jgi:transcriptional regulator with XRE-family HTH domain
MGRTAQPEPVLASTLRSLREQKGLTREKTAFRAGLTTGTLAQIELGRSAPAFDTVRRIGGALGMTLVELVVAIEAERTTDDAI